MASRVICDTMQVRFSAADSGSLVQYGCLQDERLCSRTTVAGGAREW